MQENYKYEITDEEFQKELLCRISKNKEIKTKWDSLSDDNKYLYIWGVFESCRKIRSINIDPAIMNNEFLSNLLEYDYCEKILGMILAKSSRPSDYKNYSTKEKANFIVLCIAKVYFDYDERLTSKNISPDTPKILTKIFSQK